jgi:tetratricopeptide (TPR) repeat protein
MKTILTMAVSTVLCGAPMTQAQDTASRQSVTAPRASQATGSSKPGGDSTRSDAYYYFTLGHLQEQQFEVSGSSDLGSQSIESYKKALSLEPGSTVIEERLAEIYAKSQHIREAVLQAEQVLQADPNDVAAHRLLARIYVRTLGDMNAGEVQQENLTKAIEEFQAILKIQPDDTYSSLWLARLYRFENKHDDAEKVLRGVLRLDPENGTALEQLSQLLIDEGRSNDAIVLLSHAAGDSSSPDIYGLLGDAYSQQKDYNKAEDAYRKAVDQDPDDPGHHRGLAQALLSQGKYAEAVDQYKKLSELEPGTSENYLRMSQLYRRLGQFEQAESSLLKAKQLAPGSLEVLYNEALLYEDQGRYGDAVKVLTDAIAGIRGKAAGGEQNPSALGILYEQLGHAYREQQNYPAAIETFEQMGALGPDTKKRAQALLIDTYRESRDIDRAIAETKKALQDSPKDPALTVTLAMLVGENSDTGQASKLLQGLLQGNENDREIYIDIAQVQERGKQYADAEQSAQKAEQMAQAPSDKQAAWFMLGAIYERQKKFEQAEQQFRKVLDANPNNAPVLNYYGYMLADRGVRLDEATSMIERAVKQEPSNGAYLDSLGWVYYKQNKLTEAEECLRKAVDREGRDPTILSHLGVVYIKLVQNERAAELLERSLAAWQKASPADYEAEKVNAIDSQLKTLKRRLAQKSSPETGKPQ